jgi:hypothetical protein
MSKDKTVFGTGAGLSMQSVNLESGVVISALAPSSQPGDGIPTKEPLLDKDVDGITDGIHNWGQDNLWPRQVRLKLEESTVAAPLIFKAVCAMFGTGVTYWFEDRSNGELTKRFDVNEEVDMFFRNNAIDYISLERLMDYKYFNNIFQEFILSNNYAKINRTLHLEAEFCRLAEQNEKSNFIENIVFLGDWENKSALDGEKIPLIYPRLQDKDYIQKTVNKKEKKFAVHSKFPSPGRGYYGVPPHVALYRRKGWLDYSNAIPEILNAIVDNSMNIKYHIEVPAHYWTSVYPEWNTYDEKKQEALQVKKLQEMNDFLSGKNNTMKTFISEYTVDRTTGKEISGFKINVINDETKMDTHLLTSQESDAHIARALNIDPSLAGLQPQGGKMGAGSGSDKRVSFLNGVSMSHAEEIVVLDFLYIIARYNEWPSNIRFGFLHDVPTTLDKNRTGVEQI